MVILDFERLLRQLEDLAYWQGDAEANGASRATYEMRQDKIDEIVERLTTAYAKAIKESKR